MLDDILSGIMKPGRYIGQEWNLPKKDFGSSGIKFVLCFPDLYEVGMSNLGLRIIYGILNNIPDVCCERVFAPGLDLEDYLRKSKTEIFSLESQKGLRDFDLLGFSLGHELCYTNVLNILDLGGMPLSASSRGCADPLIIGGGPCVLNPEPLHDFFDIFIIGEAEEAIVELVDVYRKIKDEFKSGRISKEELLVELSSVEGVYAPSLYRVDYDSEGKVKEFSSRVIGVRERIKKRILKDLDRAYFPSQWVVPFIQIIHDRITLEIMRGCPNRCRFCQARQQYFPFRQKSLKNILNTGLEAYEQTGYEEIALGGLSVSDYSHFEELLRSVVGLFKERCVGVSLPSIKPKSMLGSLSALISTIKKTGLTFAPEAASERMRDIIGKDFNLDDFKKALEQAFASGYQHVKLYFMIGLPGEEDTDLDEIINFSVWVSELRRKVAKYPAGVNISVNTLIPKPHTPFQWLKMEGLDNIKYKQEYLKKGLIKNRKIKISFHNRYMGFIEGVFSRGDRRLSEVIINAFKNGARFDAWSEHFKIETWLKAFKESNIDPSFYLNARNKEELLPWDFLDIGDNKESLLSEFNTALSKG